jgi:hypothetical protein
MKERRFAPPQRAQIFYIYIHSIPPFFLYPLHPNEAMISVKAILFLVVLAISAVDRSLAGVATAYGGANQVCRRLSLFL